MKKTPASQLNREIADFLKSPRSRHATRKKSLRPKTPEQIRHTRLETLQAVMEDNQVGWLDTDLEKIESWIDVSDDLSDRDWIQTAKRQLEDQSVLPEHAGAAPESVYAWNDAFISTYRMEIDQGMSSEEAIDSARQNANDTVSLTLHERGMTKTDPQLYKRR